MSDPFRRLLLFVLILGLGGTLYGCSQWITGQVYKTAANHQLSTVGQIVKIDDGPRHTIYRYEFVVNGVRVQDTSEVCKTPLTRTSCITGGPAIVYYSDQPFSNSRLEDFRAASNGAFRRRNRALEFGILLISASNVTYRVLVYLNKRMGTADSSDDSEEVSEKEESEVLSIAPRD